MMIKINETFNIRSLFPCEHVKRFGLVYEHDPVWRQTVLGCAVLWLLQDMYGFKTFYPVEDYGNLSKTEQLEAIYPHANDAVDVYVKTMEMQTELLDNAFPVLAIFTWRFGFILRRRYSDILRDFYLHPFSISVWICLLISIFLGSITFYTLSLWDNRLFGLESSFQFELLVAFSAYCQHILPLQAISSSRRVAYFTFIICAYVVHCFYTSNLLSCLVRDKHKGIDLEGLAESDYTIGLLKDMNLITDKKAYEMRMDKNLSIVWNKVQTLTELDTQTALHALMESNVALLCDYYTIYPILRRYFDTEDICDLVEIDLYSNVKNYFFTSKNFAYKEEFKIGILRAKEAGLLIHLILLEKFYPFKCIDSINSHILQFDHTVAPIVILLAAYVVAFIILIVERIHYKRNRVWPFVH